VDVEIEEEDDGTPGVDVDIEEEENDGTPGVDVDIEEEEEPNEEIALDEQTTEQEMEGRHGPRSSSHNLRPRRRPSEEHRRAMQPQDDSHLHASLEHYAMTQYSIKKGSEVFGDAGKEAVLSEMKQLHDMGVVEPKKANMLTREEKSKSLNYLIFLEQKKEWENQGKRLRRRPQATPVQDEGRNERAHRGHGVAVFKLCDRRERTKDRSHNGHPGCLHADGCR
jgi:hypothetical protein